MPNAIQPIDVPGGRFTAQQDVDGSWTILDVPFFAELPKGQRGNTKHIGSAWMKRVVERHRELEEAESHLAPVHVNHHGSGKPTRRIGFLRPTRVGKLSQRGRRVAALFGDLVKISPEDFEAIKAVDFPYRSAEINGRFEPEIASLALMSDEAPFFKLPMLTVGEEEKRDFNVDREGAVATYGDACCVLFNFTGVSEMAEKTAQDETKTFSEEDLSAALAKALEPFSERLDRIESKLAEEDTVADDKAPVDENFSALEERFSSQAAELAVLREHVEKEKEAKRLDELVGAGVAKLSDDGWTVAASTQRNMRDIAANAKDPERAIETFCETYRSTALQDPPENFDEIGGREDAPEIPEFIQRYQKEGPEIYEKAIAFCGQFEELKSKAIDVRETCEEFVANNIRGIA